MTSPLLHRQFLLTVLLGAATLVFPGLLKRVLWAKGMSEKAVPAGTSTKLRFRHHAVDKDPPGRQLGQTALADVDHDGKLEFITGRSGGDIFWYRYVDAGHWERHLLGKESPSEVGGAAVDVDGDGWVDFVTGGAWYRNPRTPRTRPFEKHVFDKDLRKVHDVVAADLDGDGRLEIITMSDQNNLRWYKIPQDPTQPWVRHDIGPSVHAGVAVGDIDGDGDLDIVRSNVWFENADGKGTRWVKHANIPFGKPTGPFPLATRCVVCDLDKDGDMDLVMTENEIKGGRIAWIENVDGKGQQWKVHELMPGDKAVRGAYHSLAVADFDQDGDLDIFTCEMEGIAGERLPRWFVWENIDGRGANFIERVILDVGLGGHEAVVGDVDGDGDLDICSKTWLPRKDNRNSGRMHVDFLENLLLPK
jgi:hypothetical protein